MESSDALLDFRSEIEDSGWHVVSWGADSHDSIIFSIHRSSPGSNLVVTLFVTDLDVGTSYYLELVNVTNSHPSQQVLENSISETVGSHEIVNHLKKGIQQAHKIISEGLGDATRQTRELIRFDASATSSSFIRGGVEGTRLPAVPFFAEAPAEVKSAYYRFGLTSIKESAKVKLEQLGHSLAEEMSHLDDLAATLQESTRRSDTAVDGAPAGGPARRGSRRTVRSPIDVYMNMFSSRGHEPIVKLLIGITLLGLSICLGIEADSVFEFAINGPAGAALSAAVGYTGGILLCSYFSGMLFRRSLRSQLEQSDRKISLRYIQPFLLAVAAVILLPLVLFAATYAYPTDLGRSISITVAPALIVALTSAMITLVFYFLGPGERIAGQYGEPTSGEGPRMSAARLRSRRRSIIRIYLQRASVLIAESEMASTAYIRSASMYYNEETWWEDVDMRPDARWIHDAERELREGET